MDEAEIERQRQAYAVEGVDESAPAVDHASKKRKGNTQAVEEVRAAASSTHRKATYSFPSPVRSEEG